MQTLVNDLRHGLRVLRKQPLFALVALLTLALGIGANLTIFSFVNAFLLRTLPYPEAERLVQMIGAVQCLTAIANTSDSRAYSTSALYRCGWTAIGAARTVASIALARGSTIVSRGSFLGVSRLIRGVSKS